MSRFFTPEHVAARFKVSVSARYRAFLEKREWKALVRRAADLPTYGQKMELHFSGAELESFFDDDWPDDDPSYGHLSATEAKLGGKLGWVPLATIGSEEAQFLATRASDATCPVAMWEHETGTFAPVWSSLDEMLIALGAGEKKPPAPSPPVSIAKMRKVVENGMSLVDERPTKALCKKLEAVLVELEPMLHPLPSAKALEGGEHHGLPSRALYAKAKMLRVLGRFEEACHVLANAVVDGERIDVAPELLCRMFLDDLDRPDDVVTYCAAQKVLKPDVRGLWGLALFRRGDLVGARRLLLEKIEQQVDNTLKLSPDKDRAKERARRLTSARSLVADYAKQRGLDATALTLD